MQTYTFVAGEAQFLGGEISETVFGANILFNRDNVDDVDGQPNTGGTFDDVIDDLGVTTLRYPGGAMAEWTFDLENPDTPVHDFGDLGRFQPHGSNTDHLGLSEFLDYCEAEGLGMTFVMPTIRFLGGPENVDANGNRYEGIGPEEAQLIREFVTNLLEEALAHGVDLQAIELGNEWYTDFTDLIGTAVSPVEYGRVASRLATIIQNVIDEFVTSHDLPETWFEPQIIVQVGHRVRDPETGEEVYSETEATQAIFAEFNLDAEQQALDGVLVHRYDAASYDLIEAMVNRNFNQFEVWDALAAEDVDFGQMSRFVTEWNISGNTENTRGLECAAAMLELFTHMMRAGVDHANIWAVQQNNVSNLSGNEGSNQLRLTGELYDLMSDNLIGLQLLNIDSGSDVYEINGFGDEGRVVIYVASRSDEPITIRLDVSALVSNYTHLSGVTLGVVDGANPLHPASQPDLSFLTEGDLTDGDYVTITLDPYEISQLSFTLDGGGVVLTGHDGDDALRGSDWDDEIDGEDGADTLTGLDGDDVLSGGAGNDRIYAGNGADLVHGGAGDDHIQLGAGQDTAFGGEGDDKLYGLRNDDVLFGGAGDDVLDGGEENDILHDGPGSDVMIGGTGADGFVLASSHGDNDVIADFEIGLDWIDVSAWNVVSFDQLHIVASNTSGEWLVEVSAGSNQVTLEGLGSASALTASDFVFSESAKQWCTLTPLNPGDMARSPKTSEIGLSADMLAETEEHSDVAAATLREAYGSVGHMLEDDGTVLDELLSEYWRPSRLELASEDPDTGLSGALSEFLELPDLGAAPNELDRFVNETLTFDQSFDGLF